MNRLFLASLSLMAALAAHANGVTDWSAIAERVATDKRPPASAQVILGLVHAAMHDAVAATQGGLRPAMLAIEPAGGDADVAAAVAAHDVLTARVPAQAAAVDAELTGWMQAQPATDATRAGEAAGHRVASAILAQRANDGAEAKLEYQQKQLAHGVWEPTAKAPPVDYIVGRIKPLAAADLAKYRPPEPGVRGEAYERDLAEVRLLGRKDSAARTAAQTETAMFWSDHTTVQWSRALRGLATERHLDTRESARMLAMAHVAAADALIACFEAKYRHLAWRPVHAIRGTEAAWDSLLNVNHPEFPSGHSCYTGAITQALALYFGRRDVPITVTSTTTKTARRYETLDQVNADVTEARILAGLHFRQSMLAGNKLGADVAAEVAPRF